MAKQTTTTGTKKNASSKTKATTKKSTTSNPKKQYDIVLFGATGFTGKLTAEYLIRASSREKFTWAIAGRNQNKLEQLKQELARIDPKAAEKIAMLRADVSDQTSLNKMAAASKVVITTVGPYILYGESLVKACVNHGADYVDLTGEPEFVELMINRYHEKAEKAGVRIVNCCGFDSIPHDLGAYFTLKALTKGMSHELADQQNIRIEGFVTAGGHFSGGTWHSAVHAFSRFRQFNRLRKSNRLAGYSSPKKFKRKVSDVSARVKYHPELHAWACPFPTIDPQVVKRSARTLEGYGKKFSYGHNVLVKKLPKLLAGIGFVGGVFALSQLEITKKVLLSYKDQGDGPSENSRDAGWFRVEFEGFMAGVRVRTIVRGGDPGYSETSKMLAESALCLAKDRRRLPRNAGVITPASAMGQALIDRLYAAGIEFKVTHLEKLHDRAA